MTEMPADPVPGRVARRGARSWSTAAIAVCATSCALITGCSSLAGGSAKPVTPATAIQLTADETQKVTSLAGTLAFEAGGVNTSGTFQFQLKPSLIVEESMNSSLSGQAIAIDEILSGTALYLKIPGFDAMPSKPWDEVKLSGLSGNLGSAFDQLLQAVENSDPLAQLQELTASTDARQLGTQVIGGVQTTRYAGTITAPAALAKLAPSLRQEFGSSLSQLQGAISWNVWIDAQHNLRKLTESYTMAGSQLNLTMTVTAINQPVSVTLPPASQVRVISGDMNSFSLAGGS